MIVVALPETHVSHLRSTLLHRGIIFLQFVNSTTIGIRVESGSDDPDYLGHFFGGSSGSHPQTKLSGCDPDF